MSVSRLIATKISADCRISGVNRRRFALFHAFVLSSQNFCASRFGSIEEATKILIAARGESGVAVRPCPLSRNISLSGKLYTATVFGPPVDSDQIRTLPLRDGFLSGFKSAFTNF